MDEFFRFPDTALHGHLLKQEIVQSEIHCIHKCVMNSQCQSINYEQCTSGSNLCELNKETRLSKPNNFVKRLGFAYYGWEVCLFSFICSFSSKNVFVNTFIL